jgi:hypothetical protein
MLTAAVAVAWLGSVALQGGTTSDESCALFRESFNRLTTVERYRMRGLEAIGDEPLTEDFVAEFVRPRRTRRVSAGGSKERIVIEGVTYEREGDQWKVTQREPQAGTARPPSPFLMAEQCVQTPSGDHETKITFQLLGAASQKWSAVVNAKGYVTYLEAQWQMGDGRARRHVTVFEYDDAIQIEAPIVDPEP